MACPNGYSHCTGENERFHNDCSRCYYDLDDNSLKRKSRQWIVVGRDGGEIYVFTPNFETIGLNIFGDGASLIKRSIAQKNLLDYVMPPTIISDLPGVSQKRKSREVISFQFKDGPFFKEEN